MVVKDDIFTLPLPLHFIEHDAAAPPPNSVSSVAEPERAYLNWRLRTTDDGEESWITKWHQDGLLLSAKVEALDIVDPEADEHLWNHRITVHTYDAQGEEVAIVTLDDAQSALADLDIFPVFDDLVHECADQCVAFVQGNRQLSLLH